MASKGMHRRDRSLGAVAAAAVLAAVLPLSAGASVVPGKAAAASKSVVRSEAFRDGEFPAAMVKAITLTPLAAEQSRLGESDDEKRTRVGVARDVATQAQALRGPSAVHWKADPAGGSVTRLSIASPGAAALRIGLRLRGLPGTAQLRVAGSMTGKVVAVDGDLALDAMRAAGHFWTPLTEGEEQSVEVWVPAGTSTAAIRIEAPIASHLASAPSSGFKSGGIGASQPCNIDAACVPRDNEALAKAARAVAKLVFTENGATFLCTATLINDGGAGTEVPYLYTAAHCVDSQAAAATVNTFWFFEASACGSGAPHDYRQLSGGTTLLQADAGTDAALLRMREAAPHGAWFAGWDASPVPAAANVVVLHHPAGDLKKVTVGQALADSTGRSMYTTAAWLSGSTEGGSSGAGLFTLVGSEYVLRGALRGGSASCTSSGRVDDPANRDYFSRLDVAMPMLKGWLRGAPAPTQDYAGLWWNPAEPGWGVSISQGTGGGIFVTWYTYDADGRPLWLFVPEGRWATMSSFEGTAYRAKGSPFDADYRPGDAASIVVGTATIAFADADHGRITLRTEARVVEKALVRFVF